jgi:hypothetical protein
MPASSPKPKQAGFWGAHQKACLLAFACQAAKTAIPGFRPGPRTLAKPANAKTSKHTERKAMNSQSMYDVCNMHQQQHTNKQQHRNQTITTAPAQQQQTNHHTAHA